MSRWSGSESASRASNRAQVEPVAALVAVFAVGVALSAYTGVLGATLPTPDRNLADPTVERAKRATTETGVADPEALAAGLRAGPEGYRLNLTLRAAGRSWHAGPTPPPGADAAALSVSVRVAPGSVRPGRLRAEVWS
ncbi:hypothetical protein M0R89_12250 [Halorussus limi]|uniref:Uncharacterized protein n=1 Tax=Halorussus limi TaxID=2938695 RepID=A0A8U0HQK5_9EURY|nr:hypothetical protein [Halorussus limi]UPV73315.1 hypothetical protein M0R89_12250 [Halorussus limi]